MGFFKKLTDLLKPTPKADEWSYCFTVQCLRCGEIIRTRVDLRNELSIEYGEREENVTYHCRKVLMGTGEHYCFQQIEVLLIFNLNHKIVDQMITGGKFVDEAQAAIH